jgi:hypothetical protein
MQDRGTLLRRVIRQRIGDSDPALHGSQNRLPTAARKQVFQPIGADFKLLTTGGEKCAQSPTFKGKPSQEL